jgi:transaldolase
MYVVSVVGPDTVNTVPPNTLEALLDHGEIAADTVQTGLPDARATIDALAAHGILITDVTDKLVVEGVASFGDSFKAMLDAIAGKQKQLALANA